MNLAFITGNKNKFLEAKKVIPSLVQVDLKLNELQTLDLEESIKFKLDQAIKNNIKTSFIIDDTSFIIDRIGLPGTLIKFFLDKLGDEGIYNFAKSFNSFDATVVCKIGFYNCVDQTTNFFEGVVSGKIIKPQGDSFGFDTIFAPTGYDKSYAQMLDIKSKISHRILALNSLKRYLDTVNY